MKLNVYNLGLAIGIATGLGVLILGIAGWLFGVWTTAIDLTATFYKGYTPTLGGSIIGAIWGFIDGFIGGVVIAWIYNILQKKSGK